MDHQPPLIISDSSATEVNIWMVELCTSFSTCTGDSHARLFLPDDLL